MPEEIKEVEEGGKRYTPKRIEWLTFMASSIMPSVTLNNYGIDYQCLPSNDSNNTIFLYIRYYSDLDKTMVDDFLEATKKAIMTLAESYGWDSWVKFEVVMDPQERSDDQN